MFKVEYVQFKRKIKMGADRHFCCKTCKKNYYLGYGSYRTWIEADSIEEYDNFPGPNNYKELLKNDNLRKCLQEHAGHDFFTFSYDYCSIVGEDLMIDAGYSDDLLCKSFSKFQQIDLEESL